MPRLAEAEANPLATLAALGTADVTICRRLVTTVGETERAGFIGSPTVLLDGDDPLPESGGNLGFPAVFASPSTERRTPPVLSS
jgi:hypothetical protein